MPKKEKKNYVYMDIRPNEKGFTFIESLLTISILLMTLPFIGYVVKGTDFATDYKPLAVQQFFYFLRDEVIRSPDVTIQSSKLLLQQQNGTTATIIKHGDRVIRKVDGKGFEIFLQDLRGVRFNRVPYGVRVSIITTDGNQYEKDIIIYR
ncbi:competence type IV pilus minor pilin ComGF [Lentibacillus cibarius]|uniref:Prepilin-type N-terminal cleavage/methylation domain-containing protein n=1 Tax=Lentibacillus cibarius TaxID=2583219 RepID=A0A5S3QIC8_9BACI|nr:ComGF family competence protein [Lentibacillus cibarius]TMN20961.1 hypothetical protein FFL34_01670 [Lentibacillus cibarius]